MFHRLISDRNPQFLFTPIFSTSQFQPVYRLKTPEALFFFIRCHPAISANRSILISIRRVPTGFSLATNDGFAFCFCTETTPRTPFCAAAQSRR